MAKRKKGKRRKKKLLFLFFLVLTIFFWNFNNIRKIIFSIFEDKPIFYGLNDLSLNIGEKTDLSNKVIVKIDEKEIAFSIDDSEVNYYAEGDYFVYYSVKFKENTVKKVRKVSIINNDNTFFIPNFPTYYQFPDYPNGCESVALYTLLAYYNVHVSIEEIVNKLKKGDSPYWENSILYGGNPEYEFVGDPREKNGYGVYQKPIIDVAEKYKYGILDYTGHSLDDVLNIVSKNIPVQVWVSISLKDTSECATWTDKKNNKKINWICNLHSVVIIGYNANYVYVSDPYTGGIEKYDRKQFEKIFNLFGRRAIYYP